MKKIIPIIAVFAMLISACGTSKNLKPNKYRWKTTLTEGEYIYNTEDLYFFDAGVNCYLYDKCADLDSVFDSNGKTLKVTADTTLKYQAYLFTDDYEYLFVTIGKQQAWIRADVPIHASDKSFLKKFLHTDLKPSKVQYVDVIPFKDKQKLFISSYDSWHIVNLNKKTTKQIGTKGGRLEACRMVFPKDCVECYIDLGWGETVIFDDNGKKK